MKLTDILLENTLEYRVKFITIKDKDVSQGSASYKDLADAKKFFDSLTKDPEVYRAQIDKILGADSSRDMGAMSFTGGSEEIERYSHPAIRSSKKFDELTPAEQDMRMFANSRLGTMAKRGFTSKDRTYKYLEEALSKSAIMRQIKDAEEILDSGEADGVPLDNETEMLVQQELARLKRMLAMNEADLTKGEERKLKNMSKDLKKSSKSHASQAKYIDKIVKENTSLEELYNQVRESSK